MTTATIILCVKIFFSRILDVSLGTLRTVCIVKGQRLAAAAIGFCEVFIWFLIVREALSSGGGLVVGAAYAAGYATGTFLGTAISGKLFKGKVEVQVVTSNKNDEVVQKIRAAGYAVSVVDVHGSEYGDEKYMLFIEIQGTQQEHLKHLIRSLDENAFIVIHETKVAYNGFFKDK